MLKPKSQVFKLKFHLAKVQAMNNKVNSKVHAYLHIDNEQLQFKGAPQLKKNIAIFGSDLQYDNFLITFDQITGLYEQKKVLLVIEFQTQGAYIKIGEVSINVGEILNEKKYRVVNVYPLSKCYDKSAKVKLAVDFIPVSEKRDQGSSKKIDGSSVKQTSMAMQRRQEITTSLVNNGSGVGGNMGVGFYKNPTGAIKSRLAEQENTILQQRIYEYEKRMDNYRIAQNQLSQRMQEQLQRKDEKISELSLQLSRQQNSIHLITLENEQYKGEIRGLREDLELARLEIKTHLGTIEELQKIIEHKEKELEAKIVSLENLSRTKENKEKHLNQEIAKYTAKYSQSEQERNKIIFELQNKLKQQLQKKDQHYQQLLKSNQSKYLQSMKAIKQRNRYLQQSSKQQQQLTSDQDNKIKSLSLQLQNSVKLSQQLEQEMTYINQELNKHKKSIEALHHEIDSITFSYHETQGELNGQKERNAQILKKLELVKTELALSNQTIEEQREKIIVMSKDLQVHEERQYYMKEHYEEELYDSEIMENTLRAEKNQLSMQLKRTKQQLKLAEDKYEQEQSKSSLLISSLTSLQQQLSNKNSLVMKLGQQKILLQSQSKQARQLISELESELEKLQQEKAYLTESLLQKKMALENDKSLEWTYKIESLQNDIQLMVDKFKNEKQTMRENWRKEEVKKLDQISRVNAANKKLKEDAQELRDKLNKRQTYLLTIEKSLKQEKDNKLELQRQLASLKESYRLIVPQNQSLQTSNKQLGKHKQSLIKQLEQCQKKSQKYKKDLTTIKTNFNRLISIILEYMVKRYNERISYQEIGADLFSDGEIVGYVNVALRKFVDDHNKTRELVKELEEYKKNAAVARDNVEGNTGKRIGQNQQGQEEYETVTQNKYKRSLLANSEENLSYNMKYTKSINLPYNTSFNTDPSKELESVKQEVDRLRKQQSQYKVKIKGLEQEIEKQERLVQNGKFQMNRVKSDLEETQDELTRVNFTLRKKDKIIKELQVELQQLQKEILQLRTCSNPHINSSNNLSDRNNKQKPQPIQQNPSLPLIRDLQSKLNLKSQELVHVQKQLQNLREQYLLQLNQIKKLEAKLKQKSTKIISLQKQVQNNQTKKTDEKDKQILRLKKGLQKQIQERQGIEDKVRQLQNMVKEYELQIQHLSQRNNQLSQHLKHSEQEFKRNLQSTEYLLNDKSTLYETQILQLKSELSQSHHKLEELQQKHSHLTLTLNKKSQQLESLKEKLVLRQKDMAKQEQFGQEQKNKMILKVNSLNHRVRQLQSMVEMKDFQIEETKFSYEGRVLQLQRQIDQFRQSLVNQNSPR